MIEDILQRLFGLLISFFRPTQDDAVFTAPFGLITASAQRAVGGFKFDISAQQRRFQLGLDGYD